MAKFTSLMFNEISGKMGAMVLSKNGTARRQVTAKNPNTPAQLAMRSGFADANAAWKALTPIAQAGWSALAKQITLTNAVGKKYTPTGRRLFISCYQNSMTAQQAPPTTAPAFVPAVPGVLGFGAEVQPPGGIHPDGAITLSGSGAFSTGVLVIRATGRLSPDRHALSPGDFRVLNAMPASAFPPPSDTMAILYAFKFGAPLLGAKIAFAVSVVDGNGFAGPVAQAAATVSAFAEEPLLLAA